MFDPIRQFVASTRVACPVLRRYHGRSWPLALLRGALRARRLVRTTSWGGRSDGEARQVRVLALLPALCLDVRERLGQRGEGFARELARAFVEAENGRIAREVGLDGISDARQRWHAFIERAIGEGVGAMNENEFLSVETDRYHLRVVRCIVAELAGEAGVPELAHAACELSAEFHGRLLPSHEFSRGSSPRNTLAHGHPYCEYVWERREAAVLSERQAPESPERDDGIAAAS